MLAYLTSFAEWQNGLLHLPIPLHIVGDIDDPEIDYMTLMKELQEANIQAATRKNGNETAGPKLQEKTTEPLQK